MGLQRSEGWGFGQGLDPSKGAGIGSKGLKGEASARGGASAGRASAGRDLGQGWGISQGVGPSFMGSPGIGPRRFESLGPVRLSQAPPQPHSVPPVTGPGEANGV